MADARSGWGRWTLRALAAALLAGVIARVGTDPVRPAPAPAVATAPANPDRVFTSPREAIALSGVPAGAVESVLKVSAPMHYGDAIWREAGVPAGPIWVRVDRRSQILSVFRGPHEIGTAVILYGAPEKPTPAGRYPVLGKAAYHISRTYNAEMPYTLWLTRDGIGIHAGNVREGAATHGCIGVPKDFARRLFDLVQVGDPVVIV
ncbi:L,D-transpeptidase family protein [Sphingomonas sp. ID1715]|uniref:L,D-transpeptidase family protein n=1 Tax=Sphingomonas sp. ID1715 TaxID=1656898 RepID=UPI001487B5D8|nr:L,D-transpeptidase family protein [Sphingomonas sp. ID1715]NNM78153.1 L,D-transpeptidase family protein [Sphingomonas sp. ID1715]